MKIFKEESHFLISKELGEKDKSPWKTNGSSFFFFKSNILHKNTLDARASFETYSKGFLIYLTKSNENLFVTLRFDEIIRFEFIRGVETVNPRFPSRFWVFLKLGVPLKYARAMGSKIREYQIEDSTLRIETAVPSDSIINLISPGYLFEDQLEFFKKNENDFPLEYIIT